MRFVYPFDEDKLIRVPIILEQEKTILIVRALIDSGADSIFIDSSIADYLGLQRIGSLDVGAAGGALEVERANLGRISIHSQDFKHKIRRDGIGVFIAKDLGEEVVLGNSFFEGECKLLFDYIEMELAIEGGWE